MVLSRTRASAFFATETEARRVATSAIAALSDLDFSHTTQQRDDCDVYAVVIDGRGFYLKVTIIMGPRLMVISLHPLEYPLRSKKGVVQP